MKTTEHIDLSICGNCAGMAANGDAGELAADEPEPLGLIDDGYIVVLTCNADGHECSESFSWSKCDGCGGLAGIRHDAVMFQIIANDNPNPCGHRGCFPDMCMA